MYSIILFDLDGTITDPKEGITKSVQYALRQLGIIEEDLNKFLPFIGPPLEDSFEKYYRFDKKTSYLAVKYYRKRYEKIGMYEMTMYPGIKELIKKLHQKGKTLYIATSKPTFFSKKIITHIGLADYFADVVGATLDFTHSKKVDIIKDIMDKHKEEPKHAFVMVGDRKHDILAANEHTIDSIGVTYGYGSHEEIEKSNPTNIADSVKELSQLLLSDDTQSTLF